MRSPLLHVGHNPPEITPSSAEFFAHLHPKPPPNPPPYVDPNPTGPQPRYTSMVTKMYPYSLRPVLIITSIVGFIWAVALGVHSIRDRNDDAGELVVTKTSKEKVFDLVLAILYFVVAAIEAFGVAVALIQSITLARILSYLAPLGIIVAFADQLIVVIIHFTLRIDLINQCIGNTYGGEGGIGADGTALRISGPQATEICKSAWNRGTWSVFAWLFLTLIVSLFFGSVALAYYRQLLDPSLIRQRVNQPQQQAFQMQPGYYNGQPPNNQHSWMVPPYPGPANAPPPPHFEKSDYHPEAEWAQAEPLADGAPSGPPPRNPFADSSASHIAPNRAEDEAWERARSEGVTAHLTGHASPPPADRSQGYNIPNQEEDDAWDQARTQGVTAHYTGAGRTGEGRI